MVLVPKLLSLFHMRISLKVNKFMSMTDKIYTEAENTLKLAELMARSPRYQRPTTDLRELRENPDTSLVLGRQDDEELIVNELCSPNNDHGLPIVAIVGKSGVGKTTLAKMVYDNKTVAEHFDKRTWIFVSDNFNLKRFLDEMHQSIIGKSGNLSNITAMEEKLQQRLRERKKGYLLVLDDVWNTDEQLWKSVESSLMKVTSFTRSKVLVTTQSFDIASKMRASLAYELKDLGDLDAWVLFERTAFASKTREQVLDLEDIGRRILSKCKGLPLAITTLGSSLRSMNKRSEWESVEESEIWGLSADQSNIMPWLLLSFYHLPNAAIKQCFVHCSIIIEKGTSLAQSRLIQAWMAQGFIQSTGKSSMSVEDIGETYVRALVANGLLQKDTRSDCCYLWMHDLMHDLTLFISRNTCLSIRRDEDLYRASELVERLRICGDNTFKSQYRFPEGETLSKLRTLICTQATLSIDFAAQARFLRDLRLIRCGLQEVPSSIGKLKHLRYLSLCKNPFRYLPKSVGNLFNLQTMDLQECYQLGELPRQVTMLVNLRHMFVPWYVRRPKGMGRLTCLRTLPKITLKDKEEWKVQELKSLSLLSGEIVIAGLEHISCKRDVVEASLKTKPGITNLHLEWTYERDEAAYMVSNDEEIMDGLRPHSNLKGISVFKYGGARISSWLLDMNNLKTVALVSCNRCEKLPTLGQLRSLEEIKIRDMRNLRAIGTDFYHQAGGEYGRIVLFPWLKILHLAEMPELRDWDEPLVTSAYEVFVFPCLERLEVHDCPSLVTAPTCFESLLSLSVSAIRRGGPLLMMLHNSCNLAALDIMAVEHLISLSHPLSKCTRLKTLKISHCKELSELCPTFTLQCMGSLENLEVMSCDSLTSFPDIQGLLSLRVLRITGCKRLSTLHVGLEGCASIETLTLQRNTELCSVPDLTSLSRLTSLKVTHFSEQMLIPGCLSHLLSLRYLEIGAFGEELDQLYGARHLPKGITELTLYGWPKVKSLPSELELLHQLEFLGIVGFEGVETLEGWMGNLSSLQELHIDKCKSLKYLPPLETMRRLTQLRKFEIFDCPFLGERCNKFGGEEWHKISHLSSIRIQFREQLN